jgi:hypothetical protein
MRRAGRAFLRAVVVSLVAVAVGPVGTAMATPPTVTIESPANESATSPTPSFSGTAEAASGEVTLTIFKGLTKIRALETSALLGPWSVSVGPAEPLNAGTYTAQATQTNLASEPGTSESVTFTVEPTPCSAAPSITGQPTDQTVTAPAQATFSAAGSRPANCEAPTAQWFSEAPGESSFSPIGGAMSGSYTTPATTTAENGTKYMAVFTNSFGQGESSAATLTVEPPACAAVPSIKEQPTDQTVTAPAEASFTASGSTPENCKAPTVQWYSKAPGASGFSPIGGAHFDSYTTPATNTGENGTKYMAAFTNEEGTTNSNEATLTVEPRLSPKVTLKQPKSPSNDTTPQLSGTTTSDGAPVVVHIFSGNTQVAEASATPSGGNWSCTSPLLGEGTYTAEAIQEVEPGSVGGSNVVSFKVMTASPTVTLKAPTSPSNNTTPTFTGSASETTTVTVEIYKGATASGSVVATATATGTGGGWTSGHASPSLSSGEYAAIATQPSSVGNPTGTSGEVRFTVETASPTVTLDQPSSPSNDTTPSFSGFASDTTTITVDIYAGSKAAGSPVSTATAFGTGVTWTSGDASPALQEGTYTAVATQPSSLGNAPGVSAPVTFVVITASPTVKLNPQTSPSNNTTPTFSGEATETTTVTIDIYAGSTASGAVVSTAAATGTGHAWTSGHASPALTSGEYTAVATQPSSFGNPAGVSSPVRFEVDTSSPTVTLTQPAPLSNQATPSFTGTATALTTVTVEIYKGATVSGSVVATATATGTGGIWSSGKASPALPSGQYTAVATQPSPLGNPAGVSAPVTFTVETAAPKVTLVAPAGRSNNTTPSFTGTATDTEPVNIQVHEGATKTGKVVATATATGTGGTWTSGNVTPALKNGQYTVVATQASSLGNPPGESTPAIFEVSTTSPTVSLNQPKTPSNVTAPVFTGTASEPPGESTTITVQIHEGATKTGKTVATATAVSTATTPGIAAPWTSSAATPALANGQYTAVASQPSAFSNPTGESAPMTFTVDTTSPKVTLAAVKTPSNNTVPVFTGTATDTTAVTVEIHKGATTAGELAATATAASTAKTLGVAAPWTSSAATPALPSGQYTAVAMQTSSAGNAAGLSTPVTFTVDTTSPKVIVTPPTSPSNNRSPIFTGTASDTTPVVVHIMLGGAEVTSITATPSGGNWTTGKLTSELSTGKNTYTAVATQESSLGNPTGESVPVTFIVDTTAPKVTLNAPVSRSSNSSPIFTGTATDTTTVTVEIHSVTAKGAVVAKPTAVGTGGSWTASAPSPALPSGRYTAIAIQKSSIIGNPTGESTPATFTVDTEAPEVKLSGVPAWLNSPTPSFSGTTNESSEVVVEVQGRVTAKATTKAVGGSWTVGNLSPSLPDGEYTVKAVQQSVLGNHIGETASLPFRVDTVAPNVTLTSSSAGNGSESVSGSAGMFPGDLATVTAQLFSGPSISGSPIQGIAVNGSTGSWLTTFGGLGPGTYTARAIQSDQAGNTGVSAPTTFVIGGAGSTSAALSAPVASFTWFPAAPHTGEPVSLASSSTDATSPITAYAWDLAGNGVFAVGKQLISTSFATPGNHLVRLRVTDASGHSSAVAEAIAVTARPLPIIHPFPIVRITSTDTSSGVLVHLLKVQAPSGARISVTCEGRGCPMKSAARVAVAHKGKVPPVEFSRFERSLSAGVTLVIRVSKSGEIGKYTSFAVRRGKLPLRVDTCLAAGGVKSMACPLS